MTDPGRRADGPPKQGADADLGNEVEGYLLWQARVAEAEQRAREFTGRMDWLTTAQRDEVERHHINDGLLRARQDLERIAARCASLRGEYERRYGALRRRCVGWTLTVCVGMAFVVVLALTR
ncbi:cytochrome C oxidase subunit I [Streptomyces sp. NBC_00582]|uniref:cytochrome C oxidase subunit I n=1 Tax=Streptomyces sp. NBC_00582 TaxID=2975783 RepID=UPI001063C1F0|nr:cytochrome C oxidase subunit I [Streptomyces sp. NBC_00582]WUB59732.1 cytochrome C oxidase subunit I [Streptomyces sp. NBC_00582]